MGSTALQICAKAYLKANTETDLTSFSMSDWPFSIAQILINDVIREINRHGNLWFNEAKIPLTYVPSGYTYDLSPAGYDISTRNILFIQRESSSNPGFLTPISWKQWQKKSGYPTLKTQVPGEYSVFNNILYLTTIPDKDYSLAIYGTQDIPAVTSETDTFNLQDADEEVLFLGVYAYLLQALGRPDFTTMYQLFQARLQAMLKEARNQSDIGKQLPRMF
jgi:hypothetical protein